MKGIRNQIKGVFADLRSSSSDLASSNQETEVPLGNLLHIEESEEENFKKALLEKARKTPNKMTQEDWRQVLSSVQYQVTREHATEEPWTGKYTKNKEAGMYTCICCDVDLFPSKYKYDSGSGWPSFFDTHKPDNNNKSKDNITRKVDRSQMMPAAQVLCSQCSAHLGHVFDDGPGPTGLRYCINSASMNFVESKDDKDN